MGIIAAFLSLEAGRRALGLALPIIAVITVVYAMAGGNLPGILAHRGYRLARVAATIFSDQGIFGTPVAVSASNIYLFLLFAGLLSVSGADTIFQNIAIALTGKKRGGPAKMAIVASCLFGSISGSAVANVMSTGAFTIPLMKRQGYQKHFAGAVEAVASTGGQIMPPIMGAADLDTRADSVLRGHRYVHSKQFCHFRRWLAAVCGALLGHALHPKACAGLNDNQTIRRKWIGGWRRFITVNHRY